MSTELAALSPFAAYVTSFSSIAFPGWAAILIASMIYWFFVLLPPVFAMNFMDRKIGADIQMRIGPNRSSPYGVFQLVADILKLFFKEEVAPNAQDGWLYKWGPLFAIVCVFLAIASIPIAENWVLLSLDSGAIFIVCALALTHLCLFWAAYSAESSWSVLSAFRLLALLAIYIVPVAIALLPAVLISGSTNLVDILGVQGKMPWGWLIFHDPGTLLSGTVFFISLQIWQQRTPLDFSTAPGEVAGGLISEYSGVRKGLLDLLQYLAFFLSCALMVAIYMGGGKMPFSLASFGRAASLIEWFFFLLKTGLFAFLSIWLRWSLPRLRIDQIVSLSWRILMPAGLIGMILTALWSALTQGKGFADLL